MTVAELVKKLLVFSPNDKVVLTFDVSDHDTVWEVSDVESYDTLIIIKAK